MHGRNSYEDELARRRAQREKQLDTARGQQQADMEEAPPKFDWRDILAMIIAAYQILFPMLIVMVGALFIAYLIFRWVFS